MKLYKKHIKVTLLLIISLLVSVNPIRESAADITPPTISILSPADGKTLWVDGPGLYPVTIVFSAVDVGGDLPLSGFSLGIDGVFTPIASVAPWGVVADTYVTTWAPASGEKNYTLQVRVNDSKGNVGYSRKITIKVRVQAVMSLSNFPGDGKLLVRDNDNTICMSCHQLKAHSSATIGSIKYGNWERVCRDCHTPHNTRNIFLLASSFKIYTGIDQAYSTNRKVDFRNLSGHSGYGFTTADGYNKRGPCEVCHTRTNHFRFDGTGPEQKHENIGGPARFESETCIDQCHLHTSGFAHGSNNNCVNCHGHESGTFFDPDKSLPYTPGDTPSPGRGTVIPHSTHTEIDSDDQRGPGLYCSSCHDLNNFPKFKSGIDVDGDGLYNLSETDVCDACHSPGGAFDGVNSTNGSIGAKDNWHTGGVYNNNTALKAGKEKWCVGCHDLGSSVIPTDTGRQAPAVAGNNSSYGFYVSGHGSKAQECGNCHNVAAKHNFDGKKTYEASLDNYQAGYRLKDVNGQSPMNIPLDGNDPGYGTISCDFDENNYRLCLTCHQSKGPQTMGTAKNLFSDTKAIGHHGCESNPYKNASSMITGFRNESLSGFNFGSEVPGNGHWDHLVEFSNFFGPMLWKSDDTNTANSRMSCPACHNPHGDSYGADIPTIRMTRSIFEINWGTNSTGDYGVLGSTAAFSNTCAVSCHFDSDPTIYKYYRDHTSPVLSNISVADINNSDPLPAEAGYTNDLSVKISFNASGAVAEEMQCAEDFSFISNATGWIAYGSPYTYTLSDSDGSKTVYCQIRSTGGSSHVKNASIIVDRISPAVGSTALTSPNGSETWLQGTAENITWSGVTDDNIKDVPISLDYSTDSGLSYTNNIALATENNGIYSWLIPDIDNNNLRVKLSAADKAGNLGTDSSDADFSINPIPPQLAGISITDNNNADPEPAEAGYTNNQAVTISINASNNPAEMMLSEDSGFTVNSTGWVAFSAEYTYTLSATNGSKTVYCKIRNGAGESAAQSNTIILDTISPAMLSSTLTAPNGAEIWSAESIQSISWNSGDITDSNLTSTPVTISLSSNGGSSYTDLVTLTNNGSWSWTLPSTPTHKAVIKIAVYDKAGNRSEDVSDGIFFISPPSAYVVTNTADSGTGSLRQAITNIESAGGNGSIWFNIDSGSLTNGVAFINLSSALPELTVPNVTIDGASQTSLQGDTNINGPEIRLNGLCSGYTCLFDTTLQYTSFSLGTTATDISISNIQFTNFWKTFHSSAEGTVLTGNHFGFASDNSSAYTSAKNEVNISVSANATIGGYNADDRNFISCANSEGIDVSGSGTGTKIINNVIGLLPDWTQCANYASGPAIHFGASNGLLENNIIVGSQSGIRFKLGASSNQVKGNTFDTYYDSGTWNTINSGGQVYSINIGDVLYSNSNIIGGPNVATSDSNLNDSNVFSSSSYAIYNYKGNYTKIFGNFIGTNPEQNQILKGIIGIDTTYASGVIIGGDEAGQAGNVISNMSSYGIRLNNSNSLKIKISTNSFSTNGDDIGDDAIYMVTGANNSITRPSISAASTSSVTVTGVTSGDRVEVYLSDYDGSGTEYGEGKAFIGSAIAGSTSVVVPISGVSINDWVTAITIQSDNDTSAFSSNFQVQ